MFILKVGQLIEVQIQGILFVKALGKELALVVDKHGNEACVSLNALREGKLVSDVNNFMEQLSLL